MTSGTKPWLKLWRMASHAFLAVVCWWLGHAWDEMRYAYSTPVDAGGVVVTVSNRCRRCSLLLYAKGQVSDRAIRSDIGVTSKTVFLLSEALKQGMKDAAGPLSRARRL